MWPGQVWPGQVWHGQLAARVLDATRSDPYLVPVTEGGEKPDARARDDVDQALIERMTKGDMDAFDKLVEIMMTADLKLVDG